MLGQTLLGKYKVTRLLDEGGMSRIYLASQAIPQREVAVKVLKDSLRANPKALEHFRREIHIMARFQHANAVAYYDSAPTTAPVPVLVMEYLRGTDLGLLLYRQGPLPPDRAGRLLAQLCDVLGAAHAQGVVHRDVKPGNLMILNPSTPLETLKLMDFGLAKMASLLYIAPEELAHNDGPVASGTPEYIAPEQVRGHDLDGRADLYSVGVVLYEMLAGKRPFNAKSPTGLLDCHLHDEPPTFAELGLTDQVPEAVEAVVRSCLAKKPDDRPRDAEELALRYEQALGKRIMPIRTSAAAVNPLGAGMNALKAQASAPPIQRLTNRNAMQHSVEAVMPEAMAMIKLKGFIHDLGGEVIESIPGMIRVRLSSGAEKKKAGLFGWLDRGNKAAVLEAATATTLELRMERHDPERPNNLTITLVIAPGRGLVTSEWHTKCKKIGMDLKAYLMGR